MVERGRRGLKGRHFEIWTQPVGALRIPHREEDIQAVQGTMERVAGSFHQEDGVVKGR